CGSKIGGSCQAGNPGPTAYSPNVALSSSISSSTTSIPVTWSGWNTADPVSTGDVIQVGNEQMLVTRAPTGSGGSATLPVTRHYNGTSAASHSSGTTVYRVPPQVGTAHVTLAPGTYVMAGGGLFVCGLSTLSAPN